MCRVAVVAPDGMGAAALAMSVAVLHVLPPGLLHLSAESLFV